MCDLWFLLLEIWTN